ncbi:MAG: hypothetical protein JWN25_1538 [Verrucomicrobiales bacterium]|nr:hypothetical protein [Verrucomicrobiales bacterium]
MKIFVNMLSIHQAKREKREKQRIYEKTKENAQQKIATLAKKNQLQRAQKSNGLVNEMFAKGKKKRL